MKVGIRSSSDQFNVDLDFCIAQYLGLQIRTSSLRLRIPCLPVRDTFPFNRTG